MTTETRRYESEPAPLANPEGRLDGGWIVREVATRKIVARFTTDGRDMAEAWIHGRVGCDREGCAIRAKLAVDKDADTLAVRLLLAGDKDGLTKLARKMADALANMVECPACGSEGPHEDNGFSGPDLTLCCRGCGEQWEPCA